MNSEKYNVSVVSGDDSDPETVEEFTRKSHYPEPVQEKWEKIRRGALVPVDDGGEIAPLDDADWLLHPSYGMAALPKALSGIGDGEYPPVTSHPVGRPDEVGSPFSDDPFVKDDYQEWIDPDGPSFMVADSEKVINVTEGEVVERFGEGDDV